MREEEIKRLIRDSLEKQGGSELEVAQLLDKYYSDPEDRSKTLFYLLGLELMKMRARAYQAQDDSLITGPIASIFHTILEMVYQRNISEMISILNKVKAGIIYEQKLRRSIKVPPGSKKLNDYLKKWL